MSFFNVKYEKNSGKIRKYDISYFCQIFILAITLTAIVSPGPSLERAVRFIVNGGDFTVDKTLGLLDWIWANTGWGILSGMFVASFFVLRKASLRSSFYESTIAISITLIIHDVIIYPEMEGGHFLSVVVINLLGAMIASSIVMMIRFNQDKNLFNLFAEMPFAKSFCTIFPLIIGLLVSTFCFFIAKLFFTTPVVQINATLNPPIDAIYGTDEKEGSESFGAFTDIKWMPSRLETWGADNKIEVSWTNTEHYSVATKLFIFDGCFKKEQNKLFEMMEAYNGPNFAEGLTNLSLDQGIVTFSIDSQISSLKSEFNRDLKTFDINEIDSNGEFEAGVLLEYDDTLFHSPRTGTAYYSLKGFAFDPNNRMHRTLKVSTRTGSFDFIFVPNTYLSGDRKNVCAIKSLKGEPGLNRVDLSNSDFSVILSVKSKEIFLPMAANAYGTARITGINGRLEASKLSKASALKAFRSGSISSILTNGFSKILINGKAVEDFDTSDRFLVQGHLALNIRNDEILLEGKVENMEKEKHRFNKTRWEMISPQIGGIGTFFSIALSLAPLGWFLTWFLSIWRSNYVIGSESHITNDPEIEKSELQL